MFNRLRARIARARSASLLRKADELAMKSERHWNDFSEIKQGRVRSKSPRGIELANLAAAKYAKAMKLLNKSERLLEKVKTKN